MADLFFPQLATGALAQYPIRKTAGTRNIRNILPDGSLILFPDPGANQLIWHLAYQDLSATEVSALSGLFNACQGRFGSFTFLDPTDNMLSQSANLLATPWIAAPGLNIAANVPDPFNGTAAFTLTNTAQVPSALSQTLYVPGNYQYCLSVYASSLQPVTVDLVRATAITQQVTSVSTSTQWNRLISTGVLPDSSAGLTISISIPAGAQVSLYGPQLEAQISPSRYFPTLSQGGVYIDAHFAVDALPIIAEAPNLYSTTFTIETSTARTQ